MKKGPSPKPPFERVMKRAVKQPNGCWLYPAKGSRGYGSVTVGSRYDGTVGVRRPARIAYEGSHGPIPAGMSVCHRCDNRSCVNPEHLFLGTSKDNAEDMVIKGRSCRGNKNARAILTQDDVIAIRRAAGTQREIADRFGISRPHVSSILSCRRWSHV
jgi:predicted XRE-type DNA-binding protein